MSTPVAADALHAADHLKEDMQNHTSLARIIDDIETEKKTRTPAEYAAFLTELNKDLSAVLPGLTIEGTKTQSGKPDLVVKDNDSTSYLSKDDLNRLQSLEQNRTIVTDTADGVQVATHANGKVTRSKDDGQGNWSEESTGPNPGDNYKVQNWADGTQLTQYKDGRGTSYKPDGHGGSTEHGWGPSPRDNYNSSITKDGHFKITYVDGHGLETYHDPNGKYIQRKF